MNTTINDLLKSRPIKNGDFVMPGTELAIIEEFVPGPGTYTENGKILASVVGKARFDLKSHKCWVDVAVTPAPIPKAGDIALGKVSHTSKQLATIDIFNINDRPVYPTYTALVHISRISRNFLDNMDNALRAGDTVKCVIVDAKTIPLQVDMTGRQFGVVHATCVNCGGKLVRKRKNVLFCPICKTENPRKVSTEYGVHEDA